jgi:hypothetical protein
MSWLRWSFALGVFAAAAALDAAHAQAPGEWQPSREPAPATATMASAAGLEPLPPVTPAQAVFDPNCPPMMACPQPMFAAPGRQVPMLMGATALPPSDPAYWQWRILPQGVIWQSYWAGAHESRISGVAFFDDNGTALLDVTLGGRVSLLRYGTDGPGRPVGAELQLEGAGIPRLNLDENWDVDATDFRFGLPLTYGRERWQAKFSYYHLSAHMGDEFAIREDALDERINFSRDALVAGLSFYPLPAWRWYAEAGWAFHYDGGSEPWEVQVGVDVAEPGPTDIWGTPFLAINGHLREEHNYGGNVVFQAGLLWRGNGTQTFRAGFHYFNGKSNQFEFFDQFEEQIGGGLWCEF